MAQVPCLSVCIWSDEMNMLELYGELPGFLDAAARTPPMLRLKQVDTHDFSRNFFVVTHKSLYGFDFFNGSHACHLLSSA